MAFESIRGQTPELTKLQQNVADLEQESYEAESRVSLLHQELQAAQEADLDAEARALNAGRKPPKQKSPEVEHSLKGASRRAEVLRPRLALAQHDLSAYEAANAHHLAGLIREAKAEKSHEVAELAAPLAKALGEYQQPDLDLRALRPHLEAPAQENHGKPADSVHFLGNFGRNNAFGETVGGQTLGQIQAIVAELAALQAGAQDEVTIVGRLAEDGDGEVA